MHPAWTALLLGRIYPRCSLVAPCRAGASPLSVLRWVSPRSARYPRRARTGATVPLRSGVLLFGGEGAAARWSRDGGDVATRRRRLGRWTRGGGKDGHDHADARDSLAHARRARDARPGAGAHARLHLAGGAVPAGARLDHRRSDGRDADSGLVRRLRRRDTRTSAYGRPASRGGASGRLPCSSTRNRISLPGTPSCSAATATRSGSTSRSGRAPARGAGPT